MAVVVTLRLVARVVVLLSVLILILRLLLVRIYFSAGLPLATAIDIPIKHIVQIVVCRMFFNLLHGLLVELLHINHPLVLAEKVVLCWCCSTVLLTTFKVL